MKTIRKGSRGNEVLTLQKALTKATNYFKGAIDGIFGIVTETSVMKFQKEKGLVIDGIVGPKTWAALEKYVVSESVPKSAHFKMSEFKCKDGTAVPKEYWGNLQKLMDMLEKLRKECGDKPVTINSGYRTQSYNKKVGGATNSLHLQALAADIRVSGKTPSEVYNIADKLIGSRGGVGRYSGFTHVDCRGYKARW